MTPAFVAATTHMLPSLPLETVPTGVALACAFGPLRAFGGIVFIDGAQFFPTFFFSRRMVMAEFESLCAKAAADILAGSLKEADDVSQVGEASWKVLSRINAAGLLTIDSQAGLDKTERAYVCGVMPVDEARQFTQRMNMAGDFVALVLEPTTFFGGTVPVTRTARPYNHFVKDKPVVSRSDEFRAVTRIPVYMEKSGHAFVIRNSGVKKPSDHRMVYAFDPRWGRPGHGKGGVFGAVVECLKDRVSKKKMSHDE